VSLPWTCLPALSHDAYTRVMRRAIFDCFKWHTQAEDRALVCPFPLVLSRVAWAEVVTLASALARETLAAEKELLTRVDLHDRLGVPRSLRSCLRRIPRELPTPGIARVMRFDFHWTTEGWRISEANTDAAGGFIESSGVTHLMAMEYPTCQPTGDPAGALSQAVLGALNPGALVGLMHLTIYSEDRQVMLYLARRFEEVGLRTCLFSPEQLRWSDGRAVVACAWHKGPVDMIVRFLPAEWLPDLPPRTAWAGFLVKGRTAVCNPAYAVLTQSKRFPLVWDALSTPLPTWRTLSTQTRSPLAVPGRSDTWVFKPAFGHEGHNVAIHGVTGSSEWERIRAEVARNPHTWAAQRRFELLPLTTAEGPLYPCLGVYAIDSQVAGAYGRLAVRPLIDDRSREVVVLVEGQ
jgi:glutathionylspermidine synthase